MMRICGGKADAHQGLLWVNTFLSGRQAVSNQTDFSLNFGFRKEK
jgi:hypothetical protein